MELELSQLDRRYELLRVVDAAREAQLLASLARHGQQSPVVVVEDSAEGRAILVDGYRRVRALTKLRQDTVRATRWELAEGEALLLARHSAAAGTASALEQGWLVRELHERLGLSFETLAQRFERSVSWVHRRLGLVRDLPEAIQEQVRRGELTPHAAMKGFVPLARAHRDGAIALAQAIAPLRPSTRDAYALCLAFARGDESLRAHLLRDPASALRARARGVGRATDPSTALDPALRLLDDLRVLAALAQRARARVHAGAVRELVPPELKPLRERLEAARESTTRLFDDLERTLDDAR